MSTPSHPYNVSRRSTRSTRKDPPRDDLLAATGATPLVTAAGTLVPYQRSKSIKVPLLCDLGATTVPAAIETATTLIAQLDLYPGKTKRLLKTYSKVATWCAQHGVDQLGQLVDDTATRLITDIAEVSDLHPPQPLLAGNVRITPGALNDADATTARHRRRIHHVHNAVVSLRSATVLTRTRVRSQRVTEDSLAHGLPTLPRLEDRQGRPLTDEEILLARLLLEIDHAEGAPPRPLIGYLLGECGIRPLESSALDTTALDDPTKPTKVSAPGVWEFGPRRVKLTDYAAANLPRLLTQLRPGDQPLTYDGAKPGTKTAHASLSEVLMRHLRRAGITDVEVTAKSLNLWRPMHTLTTSGDMKKARKHHGGRTFNLLEDLKLTVNEYDLDDGLVHLQRRDNNQLVATVTAAAFYDDSVTRKGRRKKPAADAA